MLYILFAVLWVFLFILFSILSGWRKLANHYKKMNVFDGKKLGIQSAKIGIISYNNCFIFGINTEELYISMLFPFKIGHPDLIIPLYEIIGKEEKGFFYGYVKLTFKSVEGARIRISKKLADKIEQESNNKWKYERIIKG